MRFRIFALLCALAALCLSAVSQVPTGFIPVSGTKILNAEGIPASNATLCAKVTSVRVSGGGQTTMPPVCVPVTSGTFTINLPNTSASMPQNVCVSVTVTDNWTGDSLLGPGYDCVQPTSSSGSNWCAVTACNFDNFTPNLPSLAPITPVGGCLPGSTSLPIKGDGAGGCHGVQLTADDIAPGFSVTSFTCSTCGTFETGYTVASPTNFTASYSSTPTAATISDGTHVATLSSPFTSGSLAHSYGCGASFLLNATGTSSQTATTTINCAPRTFAGLCTAAATTATESGTNAVLNDGSTLASPGLGNQGTYGPYNASAGANICLLVTGTGHTFADPATGFAYPFNAPIAVFFTNIYGSVVSMELYVSTNATFSSTQQVRMN